MAGQSSGKMKYSVRNQGPITNAQYVVILMIEPIYDIANVFALIKEKYITRDEIEAWMIEKGWKKSETYAHLWQLDKKDGTVILPPTDNYVDYARRVYELMEELKDLHNCRYADIFSQIMHIRHKTEKKVEKSV